MIRAALAALALLIPQALAADEVWTSAAGAVIYEVDIGHVAVFSFPSSLIADAATDTRAQVYLPGLGGNFENRSVHRGYWAVPGGAICSASLTTPDGMTTQRWGRAEVIFDSPAFPTGFTMMLSLCLDDPTIPLRAALD